MTIDRHQQFYTRPELIVYLSMTKKRHIHEDTACKICHEIKENLEHFLLQCPDIKRKGKIYRATGTTQRRGSNHIWFFFFLFGEVNIEYKNEILHMLKIRGRFLKNWATQGTHPKVLSIKKCLGGAKDNIVKDTKLWIIPWRKDHGAAVATKDNIVYIILGRSSCKGNSANQPNSREANALLVRCCPYYLHPKYYQLPIENA